MCKSGEQVVLETVRGGGKLRLMQTLPFAAPSCWLSMAAGAEIDLPASAPSGTLSVECWAPDLQRFYEQNCIQQLLADLRSEAGIVRLADAEFIIDVGFGIGNRDGYEQVIEPLEGALRNLGVRHLAVGGSRKVTEELHLLPVDRQIGQSGVGVNPRILLAIGVSGAPQHLNYLGQRASIIAFNRDPEAPLLTLNQRQPRPRVYPVLGDLFETVPAFIAALNHSSV
jgi:electron transfer flavoprotein alpha subunit